MCGINFIFSLNSEQTLSQKDKDDLIHMNKLIKYRGPDNSGFYFSDYAALGHNRLSIVDNRSISNQPFFSKSRNSLIVFNGEIYNFKYLRNKCLNNGYEFKTFSDTEVILALYESWGIDALDDLEGMFSFVIYDIAQGKSIIRRDRFGIKPLYYLVFNEKLYGSSELLPLLKISKFKNINNQALTSIFLFDNNCFEESLVSNIYKLLPGKQIIYLNNSFSVNRWFDLNSFNSKNDNSHEINESEFEILLAESILKQSKTEVPTCIFYSGGIDSSLISKYALKNNRNIKLFSFIPKSINKNNNDVLNAEQRAALLGANNFEKLLFDDNDLTKYLKLYSEKLYEPISDAAIIPTLFLSDIATQQGFKVALTGDGSDELFGGYSRYKFLSNHSKLILISKFIKKINNKFDKYLNSKYKRIFNSIKYLDSPELLYNQLLSMEDISEGQYNSFLEVNKEYKSHTLRKHSSYLKIPKTICDFTLFESISRADFTNLLVNQYLPKVDNSSMIFSLEARVPFLDEKIVNFIFKNRSVLPLPRSKSKPLINEVAKKALPSSFSSIPKQGYGVPIRSWLSGPLYDYLNSIKISNFETFGFNVDAMQYKLLLSKLRDDDSSINYQILNKLWKITIFSMWRENLNII